MKIAISGAGIAGCTAAFWMKRCGHEVTLIERATSPRKGGYIMDFWGVGYDVAERMGLLPQIKAAGYEVQKVVFLGEGGRHISTFSAELFRRSLGDRFTSIPRGDLASILFEALGGDVETHFGQSIESIDAIDVLPRVTLSNGNTRVFDLVIGAGGLHSPVRRLMFGPRQTFEHALGFWVAAVEVLGYQPRDELAYVTYSRPGREIGRFSLRNGRTLFLFVFDNAQMPALAPVDLAARRAILREVYAEDEWEAPRILAALDDADSIYFDGVSQVKAPHWSSGRCALVGDAAAGVSLLAGEGAGLGMTEAYVLAGELHRAGEDHQSAFRAYEQKLRSFVADKQASAGRFAAFFAPKTELQLLFRNLATRLLAVPMVGPAMMSRQLNDSITLPDYAMP